MLAHRRSENMRVTYDGHVDQVQKWFVEHLQVDIDVMAVGTMVLNDSPLLGDKEIEEMHNDLEFLNALECPPNKWSGIVFKSLVLGLQKDHRLNRTGPKKDRTAVAVQALW